MTFIYYKEILHVIRLDFIWAMIYSMLIIKTHTFKKPRS